jgi:hypothetical protein
MIVQPDLFEAFAPALRKPWSMEDDYPGWQARFLRELADAPIVACYPGLTGFHLEALAERGQATREDAGFMEPIPYVEGMFLGDKRATPASYARWVASLEPRPQYRYAITEAGRAALEHA